MQGKRSRYAVVFTPVGWHVIDTAEGRDPVAEFGLGDAEYARAKERAESENKTRYGRCFECGEEWSEYDSIVICPECHSTAVCEVTP